MTSSSTDYTDYHRFSWTYTKPPRHPVIRFLMLLPLYALIIGLFFVLLLPGVNQRIDHDTQWLYLEFVIGMSLILVTALHIVSETIRKSRGPTLVNFQLAKTGIHINQTIIPYATIDKPAALEIIKPLTIPQNTPAHHPPHYSITLPGKKPITLSCASYQTFQHLLKSLNHYLAHEPAHPPSTAT